MSKYDVPETRQRMSETDLRDLERRESMRLDDLITDAVQTSRVTAAAADELRKIAKDQPRRVRMLLLDTPPDAVDAVLSRAELTARADALLIAQGKSPDDSTPSEYLEAIQAVAKGDR